MSKPLKGTVLMEGDATAEPNEKFTNAFLKKKFPYRCQDADLANHHPQTRVPENASCKQTRFMHTHTDHWMNLKELPLEISNIPRDRMSSTRENNQSRYAENSFVDNKAFVTSFPSRKASKYLVVPGSQQSSSRQQRILEKSNELNNVEERKDFQKPVSSVNCVIKDQSNQFSLNKDLMNERTLNLQQKSTRPKAYCTNATATLLVLILLITVASVIYFEFLGDPYQIKAWLGLADPMNSYQDNNSDQPTDGDRPYDPSGSELRSRYNRATFLVSLLLLKEKYIPQYSSKRSIECQAVTKRLENSIASTFRETEFHSTFRNASVLCFTNGSLIATLRLSFLKKVNSDDRLPKKEEIVFLMLRQTCKGASFEGKNYSKQNITCDSHWLGKYQVDKESLANVAYDACSDDILIMTSPHGVIASPSGLDGNYRPHEHCEWRLVGQLHAVAKFTVLEFDTEKDYDVLLIYKVDETNMNSKRTLAARLTGHLARGQQFIVSSHQVSITFASDAIMQKSGFLLSFRFVNDFLPSSEGCSRPDVILTSASGGFTSAGYPYHYPNNLQCVWTILVDPNKVIKFHLQDFKTRNANDLFSIYLVKQNRTVLFESIYGENSNREIITGSNQAIVLFRTNSFLRERGFLVTYTSENPVACPEEYECPDGTCIQHDFVCDGEQDCMEATDEHACESNCNGPADRVVQEGLKVELKSMNYPNEYNPSSKCSWRLSARPKNLVIEIQFVDFSTEIPYDKLNVFEGIGRSKSIFQSFTGKTHPSSLTTSSHEVTVTFESDETVQSRGFKILATAKAPGTCPGNYDCGNATCISKHWLCDGTVDCSDGNDERMCESGCGEMSTIVQESFITTTDYPDEKYKDRINCVWRIYAPSDKKLVSLGFEEFATEEKHDVLRIYEGSGRNKTLQASFSGVIKPPTYVSRTWNVTLSFSTDGSVTNRGFNISVKWIGAGHCPGRFTCNNRACVDWEKVCDENIDCVGGEDEVSCPSGCGGSRDLLESEGWMASLHHPSFYPDNLKCVWRFNAKPKQLIQMEFFSFNTESNTDLLKVFYGFGREKRLHSWYSGNRLPVPYRSRYHQLTVEFMSDSTVNRPGFNISYFVGLPHQLQACGTGDSRTKAVGMASGIIQDIQITASSTLSRYWAAHKARLNYENGAWASATVQPHRFQWLQIDFMQLRMVTGISTQGFYLKHHFFVSSYMIHHSYDGIRWRQYVAGLHTRPTIFTANNDSTTVRHNNFDHPFIARYIRIVPRTWFGSSTVMRVELYACVTTSDMSSGQEGCSEGEFECGDGSCVSRDHICDAIPHCSDRSDEEKCAGCRWNQFECLSGECIGLQSRCDEASDCKDGSDEIGCATCKGDDFLCYDESVCIGRKWRCDGFKDCLDFSDERRCNHTWLCDVLSDHRCDNGQCIAAINVKCNGVVDCVDRSDELSCDCGNRYSYTKNNLTTAGLLTHDDEPIRRNKRIVGGIDATPHSWPWQASLRRSRSRSHFCGATLIDKQWIVTAAHCLVRLKSTDFFVMLGLHKRKSNSVHTQVFQVDSMFMHPRYDDQSYDFDVAMVRLRGTVTMSDAVNLACLPPFSHVFYPRQSCWVTGWGTIYSNGPLSRVLQEAQVSIMENKLCNRPMWYDGKLTPRMLCAGRPTGGVDACQGDSGGPLVCQERGQGRWFLAGIVSWGTGCGGFLKPGIYTKVTELSNWIKEILRNSRVD